MIEGQNAYAERLCFGYIKFHVIHEILVKTRLMNYEPNMHDHIVFGASHSFF